MQLYAVQLTPQHFQVPVTTRVFTPGPGVSLSRRSCKGPQMQHSRRAAVAAGVPGACPHQLNTLRQLVLQHFQVQCDAALADTLCLYHIGMLPCPAPQRVLASLN